MSKEWKGNKKSVSTMLGMTCTFYAMYIAVLFAHQI